MDQLPAGTFAGREQNLAIDDIHQWRPTFGPDRDTFRMVDLLMFAFDNDVAGLNPLGDA